MSSPIDNKLNLEIDVEPEAPRDIPTLLYPTEEFQLDFNIDGNISPYSQGKEGNLKLEAFDRLYPNEACHGPFGDAITPKAGHRMRKRQCTPHPVKNYKHFRHSSPLWAREVAQAEMSERSAKKMSFKINKTTKNLPDTPKKLKATRKITKINDLENLNISRVTSNDDQDSLDEFENSLENFRTENGEEILKNTISYNISNNDDLSSIESNQSSNKKIENFCDCEEQNADEIILENFKLEDSHSFLNKCQTIDFSLEGEGDEELVAFSSDEPILDA